MCKAARALLKILSNFLGEICIITMNNLWCCRFSVVPKLVDGNLACLTFDMIFPERVFTSSILVVSSVVLMVL